MKILFFLMIAGLAFGQEPAKPADKPTGPAHVRMAPEVTYHFKFLVEHRQLVDTTYKSEIDKLSKEQADLVSETCKKVDASPGVDCNIDLASGEYWKEAPKPVPSTLPSSDKK